MEEPHTPAMTSNPNHRQPRQDSETKHHQPAQRILSLTPEAIAQIHSSKHITTLQGVVGSLLENSLDAGATKVDIQVDWRRGSCAVDDNGIGIPSTEFVENGGLGRMYCTSKGAPIGTRGDYHGSNGTFLAELAAMSLLSITSTHIDADVSSSLTMHNGKVIARNTGIANDSDFATLHRRHGTCVSIRDLFGNMPVRVKQRALVEGGGVEHTRSWTDLKLCVVRLLLAWRHPCMVKVRDTNSDSRVVTIGSQKPNADLTEKSLGQLAGKSAKFDLRDVLPALFQSGFAPFESRNRWVPLSASTSSVSLKGMICQDPAPTKQCQFIAVGITPCEASHGHHEFYSTVNKIFSNSKFGASEILDSANGTNRKRTPDDSIREQLKAQKGVDRYAMFCLQLHFKAPTHSMQADRLNDASVKALVDVLEAAVTAWLESSHFRPRKRGRLKVEPRNNHGAVRSSPSSKITATPGKALSTSATATGEPFPEASQARDGSSFALASVTSGIHTKRRKIIDLSTDRLNGGQPEILEPAADLNALSRIRAGTSRSKVSSPEQRRTSQRASASPAVDRVSDPTSFEHEHRQLPSRPRLQPPTIRVGQYDETTMAQVGTVVDFESHSNTHVPSMPSSDDFGSIEDTHLLAAAESVVLDSGNNAADGDDGIVSWTDPASRQIFRINSRTGVVLPVGRGLKGGNASRKHAAIDAALSSAGKPLSLARRSAQAKERPGSVPDGRDKWLAGFLKEWKNPVFSKRQEDPIPCASLDGPGLVELEEHRSCCSHDDRYSRAFPAEGKALKTGTKLSKSALGKAQVIAQVNQKFILVKMPASEDEIGDNDNGGENKTLVLIDQHAASERIILETLLASLFTPTVNNTQAPLPAIQTTSLVHETARSKSIVVEISPREHELFSRYRAYFTTWGIRYDLPPPPPPHFRSALEQPSRRPKTEHRLIITHLPTPVAERCANFPALAIEMLRTEVWAFEDGRKKAIPHSLVHRPTSSSPPISPEASAPTWLNLPATMPTNLLTMLHSRACRSAIMFNDSLNVQQCQDLVDQLSSCVFPFVCAHGRVGMVPVMDLGKPGEEFSGFDGGQNGILANACSDDEDQDSLGAWREREKGPGIEALAAFMRGI